MRLLLAKCLLVIAYSFILGHSLVTHNHHNDIEKVQSHHDHDDDHNIFSFGQLDDTFVPSQNQVTVCSDCAVLPFMHTSYNLTLQINFPASLNNPPAFQEFPPPKNYFSSLSYRGPPAA